MKTTGGMGKRQLHHRMASIFGLMVVLLAGGRWLYSVPAKQAEPPKTVSHPLHVDRPYPVSSLCARSGVVLPFERNSRYLLIVGSLGDPAKTYRVRFTSEPARQLSPIALEGGSNPYDGRPNPSRPHRMIEDDGFGRPSYEREKPSYKRGSNSKAAQSRTFHLHVTDGPLDDPRHYTRIAARLIAVGESVGVYLDTSVRESKRVQATAAEVVSLLQHEILPRCRRLVGRHRDVDGDGRLTVLLTPWLGRLQGGRTALGGLVRSADFRVDTKSPFGNRCDMLFLNSSLVPGPHLKTLLAHEYTHVLAFSNPRSASDHGAPRIEDDWINEGLAHVFERLHGGGWSNLDYRLFEYLDSPERYPLVVPNYHAAGLWRNHGCRGATFLFLQWCAARNGPRFLRRMLRSPHTGIENLERATGERFEDLFRRWAVAMYLAGREQRDADTECGFRNVPLNGRCGKYRLRGPRQIEWNVGKERTVNLRGTAVAFVAARSGDLGETLRRLRIDADAAARLRVTLIKLRNE